MPRPRRPFATLPLALLLAILPAAALGGDRRPFAPAGTPRQSGRLRTFDVQHIKAELAVDLKAEEIRGTVTHAITPLAGRLSRLELDCGARLKVDRVALASAEKGLDFTHEGDRLAIKLDRAYEPGEPIALAITYHGSPDRGIYFVPSDPDTPERPETAWTQGEPDETRDWLPCYDYPNDRATSEMIVTADRPLTVVSNGKLVEVIDKGKRATYHWKMDVPHSSYLISLAVADFAAYRDQVGDLPLEYYTARAIDEKTARRTLGKTPEMIRFFGALLDRPYPYAKYAQVAVPEYTWGGMENISATTLNDNAFRDEIAAREADADGLVAHELAHQWFGDLLTCQDWSHIWLNEGFATYFASLYTQEAEGDDAFRIEMARTFRGYLGADSEYRRPIVESRFEAPVQLFDGMAYAKGACVLHALRGLLGEDAWRKGIRKYVHDRQQTIVSTDDFRKAMEESSGKDLAWFFDQWTARAGHPEIKARWRFEEADKTVRVRIDQVQATDDLTPYFRLPTTLELGLGESARSLPIVLEGPSLEVVIPADSPPKLVRLDPKGWLPAKVEWEKPAAEWTYQLGHDPDILGRLDAARALGKRRDDAEAAEALAEAWTKEKAPEARSEVVARLAEVGGPARAGLMKALRDDSPRVRKAALEGLAKLPKDDAAEAALRASWADAGEAYGVRRTALEGLAGWDVKDREGLLLKGLATPSFAETIAESALRLLAKQGGPKAREAVAASVRPGRGVPLRLAAIREMEKVAGDDSEFQEALVGLVDDRSRPVRAAAWDALGRLKVKRSLPLLEARREREQRVVKPRLDAAIAALKGTPRPSDETKQAEAFDRQAEELELRAREIRNRAEGLRLKLERARLKDGADAR